MRNVKSNLTAEFSIGDWVTFNPCGTPHPLTVMTISVVNDRVLYGLSSGGSVTTQTSGLSIEQSRLFEPYPSLLNLPSQVFEYAERDGVVLAVETFDSGDFKAGFAKIDRLLRGSENPSALYIMGALHEAIGDSPSAVDFFSQSLQAGFILAEDRLKNPKNEVQVAFSGGGGSLSFVVQCDRDTEQEVLTQATQLGYKTVGRFPQTSGEVFDTNQPLRLTMTDRYRAPRFLELAKAGAIPKLSVSPAKQASVSAPSV